MKRIIAAGIIRKVYAAHTTIQITADTRASLIRANMSLEQWSTFVACSPSCFPRYTSRGAHL